MATDTSTPSGSLESDSTSNTDNFFAADQQDGFFDGVQLAQADGAAEPAPTAAAAPGAPQQIAIPAGADVVRVPVQPGDVLVLGAPFTGEAEIIGRIGDGNLAIRVGDVTVILQGYVDANQQAPITVETANGQPIDVATMLASTDPTIDIQTAAGPGDPAAGPQGADNNGALLTQFGAGAGLGGFRGVGAQDQTELNYGLIDNSIRNDFADTLLGTPFGFTAAGPLGQLHESRLRDPANTTDWDSYANFANQYFAEGNWADFFGTLSSASNYLDFLHLQAEVKTTTAPATVLLTDIGNIANLTSNGSPLYFVMRDDNATAFIYRADGHDDALVAVVHVSVDNVDPTLFHIDTYLINRLDDVDGDGNPTDLVELNVEFNVYPGEVTPLPPSESQEEQNPIPEGGLPGTATFPILDDAPLTPSVTYENLDGRGGGDGLPTNVGLIDEDWLQNGAGDKGADGTSNAGDNGDTVGGVTVTGKIDVIFGADGPAISEVNPADKHAFVLDTTAYIKDAPFPYNGDVLKSGDQTLYVLSVGDDHLVVGIQASGNDPAKPIFSLTLDDQTAGTFTFTLMGPLDHGTDLVFAEALVDGSTEETIPLAFAVIATDDDGDSVTTSINIDVNDDLPVARDDEGTVEPAHYGPITGNVMDNDSQGGDTAAVTGASSTIGGDQFADINGDTTVVGKYGLLILHGDGSYSYTRDPGTKGGVDDIFTYTLTDKDGDTSSANLTIHIGDADVDLDMPAVGAAGTVVYEKGLPERNGEPAGSGEILDGDGKNNSDPSESVNGSFKITAPDGIATVAFTGGPSLTLAELEALGTTPVTITTLGIGKLTLTGFDSGTGVISYTFTATDNQLVPAFSIAYPLTVTDIDGDSKAGALTFQIVDDVPTAHPDTDQVDNATDTATGNVITGDDTTSGKAGADIWGADGAQVTVLIGTGGFDDNNTDDLEVAGTHGTLKMAADGSYTYTRTDSDPLTATDTFTYGLQDSDTGFSTTTLTINIDDHGAAINDLNSDTAGGDVSVDEDDLSDGSQPLPKDSTTATGTFTISAPDGVKDLTIDGNAVITGGTFSATSFSTKLGNTLEVVSYVGDTITYKYTLNDNTTTHANGLGQNEVFESLKVELIDTDGDKDDAILYARIVDDVPTAVADTGKATAGVKISGDVDTNDVAGADGITVVGVAKGTVVNPVFTGTGTSIAGDYGTLILQTDGSYTYQAKTNDKLPVGTSVDSFIYTIQDGDGDVSTTTLKISVSNVVLPTDTKTVTVNEAALDTTQDPGDLAASTKTGSNPGSPDETKTGQLNLGAGITAVEKDYFGSLGVLHVKEDGSFTYTLTTNMNSGAVSGANTVNDADVFAFVEVHDADGNTGFDTVKVNVIDDVPQPFNPQDQSLLNSPSGGVITGSLDIAGHTGADGYASIAFSGGTNNSKAMLADGITPITSGGKDVLLTGFGTDTLTGYVDANGNNSVDKGEAVFTVKLDGAADQYTFTLIKDIDDGARIDFTDFSGIKAGNTAWFGVGANGGAPGSKDLLYTPVDLKLDINTSNNDIGSKDQWIDKGEGVRVDFVNDLTGTMKDQNGFDFAGHYQVQDYQVTIAQVQGGPATVRLSLADVTKQNNLAGTTEAEFLAQTLVAITAGELVVMRGGNDVTGLLTIDYTNAGANDGSIIVGGLLAGDIIKLHDSSGFDRVEIDGLGNQFALTGSQVLQTVAGIDLDMKFQTTLKDGDGDTSTGQYIGINLQTDDGTAHTFNGGPGNDTIKGGSGSDLIFGDAGNDTLLYDSQDTFKGGDGFDRVLVENGGNSITYTAAKFIGIEMFDLGDGSDRTGAGQNTLTLSATDVIAANGSATAGTVAGHNINFFVIGDTAGPTSADHDNVVMTGFGSKLGTGTFVDPITNTSHTYDVYATVANPAVKVAIEQNLDVT